VLARDAEGVAVGADLQRGVNGAVSLHRPKKKTFSSDTSNLSVAAQMLWCVSGDRSYSFKIFFFLSLYVCTPREYDTRKYDTSSFSLCISLSPFFVTTSPLVISL